MDNQNNYYDNNNQELNLGENNDNMEQVEQYEQDEGIGNNYDDIIEGYKKKITNLEKDNLNLKGMLEKKQNENNKKLKESELIREKVISDKEKMQKIIEELRAQINSQNSNNNDEYFYNKVDKLEKENEDLSQMIYEKEKLYYNLENKFNEMKKEMKKKTREKDEIIKKLRDTINSFSKENNRQVDSLHKNCEQKQEQIDQLILDRDKLLEENEGLKNGIIKLNNRVKDMILNINNKNYEYNSKIRAYEDKLTEYKKKIILLKQKIDEMHLKNNNLKDNNFLYTPNIIKKHMNVTPKNKNIDLNIKNDKI